MIDNLGEKAGIKNFAENPQNINRNGRPLGFKTVYRQMLEDEGGNVIWVRKDAVVERTRKDKDGKEVTEVGLPLTKKEAILAKLDRLMHDKNPQIAAKVIMFLWEQMDGKANQTVDINSIETKTTTVTMPNGDVIEI